MSDITEVESTFPGDEYDDSLMHIGVLHKSGRYPWGSGENPNQRNKGFLDYVENQRKLGVSEANIAKGMGISTTELRAAKTIAKNEQTKELQARATRLREEGNSNVAIGKIMGYNESRVRDLLNPAAKEKADILGTTANMLRDQIKEKGVIDVGSGVENALGISKEKLGVAVAMLKEEGYPLHYVKVQQLGTGKFTSIKVLAEKDTPYMDVFRNPDRIRNITEKSEDGGRTFDGMLPPKSVDLSRVDVRYSHQGGKDMDGVIEVRRGVDDVSLGGSKYAQVRIAVNGTHYLKGMAIYADDLPPGVDLRFNTNKEDKGDKLKAMKPMKDDPENPFGSVVKQPLLRDEFGNIVRGKDGKGTVVGVMNKVNDEGDWHEWSKSISSQALSKQSVALAKNQLDIRYQIKKQELDDIMALTNPAVKKKLLESYADDMDSSAVHLKAAALPRQRTQVILPVNSLRDNEIYAPNFKNGENVVLIRYPHGGTFEIPELRVNNRNPQAKSIMENAIDAVGINSKVAERLSGADFDGDTVLVIPNDSGKFKSTAKLKGLEGFDPQSAYAAYDGMPRMSPRTKQLKMGDVSNLITDMTILGATPNELARAVRHSMVVIDAEKHNLNWRQSAKDNNISDLKKKYQGGATKGATTIVSRASSPKVVNERRAAKVGEGGAIDPVTGRKNYVETGNSYVNRKGETVFNKTTSTRMAEVDDAFDLVSKKSAPAPMEVAYANHANRLKALANESRKAQVAVKPRPYSATAKQAYSSEVGRLNAALNVALKNRPLERQAQLVANAQVSAKRAANPDMDAAELKKLKGIELNKARDRVGAKKEQIQISDREWEAIQSGAITNNKLEAILNNTKIEDVKALATPRAATVVVPAKLRRAQSMLDSGYTQAEIAESLGINASTLSSALSTKGR